MAFTRLLKLNLERAGRYTVCAEHQGSRALATAKAFHPDAILLDLIMPEISGEEIAAQFQSDEQLKQVPIVFLTALLSRDEVPALGDGRIGGHQFLAKPVRVDEVVACLEQLPGPTHQAA